MTSENPYQSPEPPSNPDPGNDLVQTRFPAWRLGLLVTLSLPGLSALTILFYYLFGLWKEFGARLALSAIYIVVIAFFIGSAVPIVLYWRARTQAARSQLAGSFLVALIFLSYYAASSAFVSICAPPTWLVAMREADGPPSETAFAVGMLIASPTLPLVAYLAYGIWRDAQGRKKKSIETTSGASASIKR